MLVNMNVYISQEINFSEGQFHCELSIQTNEAGSFIKKHGSESEMILSE